MKMAAELRLSVSLLVGRVSAAMGRSYLWVPMGGGEVLSLLAAISSVILNIRNRRFIRKPSRMNVVCVFDISSSRCKQAKKKDCGVS